MKRVSLLLVVVLVALAAGALPAQAGNLPRLVGKWRIVSLDNRGTNWGRSILVITDDRPVALGYRVEGYFDWVGSNGSGGREYFRGDYRRNRRLELVGYRLENPRRIVMERYRAEVSRDGRRIEQGGWTSVNGVAYVPGTWGAVRQTPRPEAPANAAGSKSIRDLLKN